MSLDGLIQQWKEDPDTAPNFVVWKTLPLRPAQVMPFPETLQPGLANALRSRGINSLYSHQSAAWTHLHNGKHVALATGTASGKSLAYNLPVLSTLMNDSNARALYLFPTKALTQDQLSALERLNVTTLKPAIYDGDTPQAQRSAIRKSARIIFSNPDMLHTGILPHHTNWAEFFSNLKFVVVDEMHTYRGVFGSHVANVIRRLKRIAKFYGAYPQFILTSATIGNAKELAEKIIEEKVELIDTDGAARGERNFIIYNPPVVDEALGLRKSAIQESIRLAKDLLKHNVQSVMFARSRKTVEMILSYLQGNNDIRDSKFDKGKPNIELSNIANRIRGYRSGYLPSQRREIEKGLRDGEVSLVVATNALELGIDIGGLGAAVLVGYPGTIASVYQQAGRAGRGDEPSLSIMVATPNPLDQFLAHHPDYFFARSPEQALINPDHLLILLNHLRCALFELPFQKDEKFGGQNVEEYLNFLTDENLAHLSNEKYFWMADQYPAASVSLRSASPQNIILHVEDGVQPRAIGEVDANSALWMTHPNAVYLHEGQQYFVQSLNLETRSAVLIPVALDYYTEAIQETEITLLSDLEHAKTKGADKAYGELQVTNQIKGFKKLRWLSNENLGEESLEMPASEFQTTGYWLALDDAVVESLRADNLWTNDPNDYGPDWKKIRDAVRARDNYRCQICGAPESANRQHDVHHKIPFRQFTRRDEANLMDNLTTLCHSCHHKAEQNVRVHSGLAGLSFVLSQLAPLFLMCDPNDLGRYIDPLGATFNQPAVVLYDQVPAGIGFSQKLFEMHTELIARAYELVSECDCKDGCPSCVGPGGENGGGGKEETLAILKLIK